MTTEALIDAIIAREGGYSDLAADAGGPTNFGITAADLGAHRALGRSATPEEVQAMPVDEAKAIYRHRYVRPFDWVPSDDVKAQLVDTGVLSGVITAIRLLQGVLGVPVDGVVGPRTTTALAAMPSRLVNNGLVGARAQYLVQIVERNASQRVFLFGWLRRTVSFFTT